VPGELIQVEYTAPDARSIAAMGLAYSKGAIDYLGPQSCSVLVTRIRAGRRGSSNPYLTFGSGNGHASYVSQADAPPPPCHPPRNCVYTSPSVGDAPNAAVSDTSVLTSTLGNGRPSASGRTGSWCPPVLPCRWEIRGRVLAAMPEAPGQAVFSSEVTAETSERTAPRPNTSTTLDFPAALGRVSFFVLILSLPIRAAMASSFA
jgi:hypothetical protein